MHPLPSQQIITNESKREREREQRLSPANVPLFIREPKSKDVREKEENEETRLPTNRNLFTFLFTALVM